LESCMILENFNISNLPPSLKNQSQFAGSQKNTNSQRESCRANWHAGYRCHRIAKRPVMCNERHASSRNAIMYAFLFSKENCPTFQSVNGEPPACIDVAL
jgi:hypothetical protein